jgi:multisubunit Na+/H+ antiporter MnhB subunit
MKSAIGAVGIVVVLFLLFSITGNPGGGLNGLPVVGIRIAIFALSLVLLYQAYDSFRSAFRGIQPNTSAPSKDPTSASTRLAGFVWGAVCLSMASLILLAWIFRLGPWKSFHGG